MKNYKFYKDSDRWFVDLPESDFSKMELEMVAGADTFCDVLAQGENEVYITLSDTPFEGCEVLQFTEIGRLEGFELGEGAWYFLNEYQGVSYCIEMWLCDVTKYVFGDFPNKIYYK
jgi:hypothetical protein